MNSFSNSSAVNTLIEFLPSWYNAPKEAPTMTIEDWLMDLKTELFMSQGGCIYSQCPTTLEDLGRVMSESQLKTPAQIEEVQQVITKLEVLREEELAHPVVRKFRAILRFCYTTMNPEPAMTLARA